MVKYLVRIAHFIERNPVMIHAIVTFLALLGRATISSGNPYRALQASLAVKKVLRLASADTPGEVVHNLVVSDTWVPYVELEKQARNKGLSWKTLWETVHANTNMYELHFDRQRFITAATERIPNVKYFFKPGELEQRPYLELFRLAIGLFATAAERNRPLLVHMDFLYIRRRTHLAGEPHDVALV